MPKISVITPSIRPLGLHETFITLRHQTYKDFEWLPRLSIPGAKPDLCKQMNRAIAESQGELIVFLQDHIQIERDGLQRMWDRYQEDPHAGWTAPVGKRQEDLSVKWDWRPHWKHRPHIPSNHWEIDWGSIPREKLEHVFFRYGHYFFERYDDGFGWENVDLAYIMEKMGVQFRVDTENKAVAYDHDAHMEHPFKHKNNQGFWITRKAVLDMEYGDGEGEDSNLEAAH